MSSGKHFDEIDENALGEVTGAGADGQRKKLLEIIRSAPPVGAHSVYAVTPKVFSPKKDEKNDGNPEKIDENVLNKVNGGRSSWEVLVHATPVTAYGITLPSSEIIKKLSLDKDSKDKDKKENAGETGENKS